MGEHHCVDETDAPRQPSRDWERERRQHAGPEEKHAGRRERQIKALEQPQGEQGLDNEAAGEGIEAEQGRKLEPTFC